MKINRKFDNRENKTKKQVTNNPDAKDKSNGIKKIWSFSVTEFRRQLKQGNGLAVLEQFLNAVKSSKGHDYIIEYLNLGGNCLELLQNIKLHNKITAILVFELVILILTKMGYNYPEHNASTFESCSYIFNNYKTLITEMINQSFATQETYVCLKLLIAMVTFLFNLARNSLMDIYFRAMNTELQIEKIGDSNIVQDFLTKFSLKGYHPPLSIISKQIATIISMLRNSSVYNQANKQHNIRSKL